MRMKNHDRQLSLTVATAPWAPHLNNKKTLKAMNDRENWNFTLLALSGESSSLALIGDVCNIIALFHRFAAQERLNCKRIRNAMSREND